MKSRARVGSSKQALHDARFLRLLDASAGSGRAIADDVPQPAIGEQESQIARGCGVQSCWISTVVSYTVASDDEVKACRCDLLVTLNGCLIGRRRPKESYRILSIA